MNNNLNNRIEKECPSCKKKNCNFIDKYIFHILFDQSFFNKMNILNCKECDLTFANPMPDDHNLEKFYSTIYRAKFRPHSVDDGWSKDILNSQKNLINQFVNLKDIQNILDIGAGNGDLLDLLKKETESKIFFTERDNYFKKILLKKDYIDFDQKENSKQKFDLIISTHTLHHFNSIDKFFDIFKKNIGDNTFLFIEVPHNSIKKWFYKRPYDSPHLFFFSKKSLEQMFKLRNYEVVFLNYIGNDIESIFQIMRKDKRIYEHWSPNFNPTGPIKKIKRKINFYIPPKIIKFAKLLFNLSILRENRKLIYGNENSWCLRILVKKK